MYKTTFKGQDIEEDKIDFESLDYKNIKVLNNFIDSVGSGLKTLVKVEAFAGSVPGTP